MRHRDPESIIKLYHRLWRRAVESKGVPFDKLKPKTLTGRSIVLLIPQMLRIRQAMNSQAYRDAVSILIHSN